MSTLFLLAAVTAGSTPTLEYDSAAVAARELTPRVQTGTLLFHQGDCLAVRVFTNSSYTHVAAVVVEDDGKPYIYDSGNGVGVRRQPLNQYLQHEAPAELALLQPRRSLSEEQASRFEAQLESRLGTPYAVLHHVTGKRGDGLHCAEYVTDVLIGCNMISAKSPPSVSPATLLEGLSGTRLYQVDCTVCLVRPEPPVNPKASWCSRTWACTKRCTVQCCTKLQRWMFCK